MGIQRNGRSILTTASFNRPGALSILALCLMLGRPGLSQDPAQSQAPELVAQTGGNLEMSMSGTLIIGPHNDWVLFRDQKNSVRIFDVPSRRLSRTFTLPLTISAMAGSPVSNQVALVGETIGAQPHSVLAVLDVLSGKELWEATIPGGCQTIRYDASGDGLIGFCSVPGKGKYPWVGASSVIKRWSATDGSERSSQPVGPGLIGGVVSEDSELVVGLSQPKIDRKALMNEMKKGRVDSAQGLSLGSPYASMNSTISEAKTGRQISTVPGFARAISSKAQTAVTLGSSGVLLIDLHTGRQIATLRPGVNEDPSSAMLSPATTADGSQYLLPGLLDFKVVDASTGAVVRQISGDIPYSMSWAISPDKDYVAVGQANSVILFHLADGTRQMLGDQSAVLMMGSIAANAFKHQANVGNDPTFDQKERKIQEDQLAKEEAKSRGTTKKELQKMEADLKKQDEADRPKVEEATRSKQETMQSMVDYMSTMGAAVAIPAVPAFLDDGRLLALRSADGGWGVWDVATGNPLPVHKPLADYNRFAQSRLHPEDFLDARDLASIQTDLGIKAHAAPPADPRQNPNAACVSMNGEHWVEITYQKKKLATAVLHHADGSTVDLLATGVDLSSLNMRSATEELMRENDAQAGIDSRTASIPGESTSYCSLSPDGTRLIVEISRPDLKEARNNKIKSLFSGFGSGLQRVMYGNWMYGRMMSDSLAVYNTSDGKKLCMLENTSPGEPFDIGAGELIFSPDNSRIVAGGKGEAKLQENRSLRLWDGQSCKQVRSVPASDAFAALGISTDGKLAYTSMQSTPSNSEPNTGVQVWNLEIGKHLYDLPGVYSAPQLLVTAPSGRTLLAVDADNALGIFDSHTGARLGTMHPLQEGEWLVTSSDGLFDGSPRGWKQIAWRDADGPTTRPGEVFFSEFYRPGLLAELLDGYHPKLSRTIAQVDRRQPGIKLAATGSLVQQRSVHLRIDVAESPANGQVPAGGIRDVRLFRNGILIKAWRGDLKLSGGALSLETDATVISGDNRFTAYAFNHDNVKSSDAEVIVHGGATATKGTAYIVAVGVNHYANSEFDLRYAVPDATRLGELVEKSLSSLNTYGRVVKVDLLDSDATKANLRLALDLLSGRVNAAPAASPSQLTQLRAVEPEDAVVVYFAGHGVAWNDHFYLVPHDMGYDGPRAELKGSIDQVLGRSISDSELEQEFEPIDAGQILLIIDACNSGKALEAEESRRGPMNNKGLAQLAYEKGMYVLTASQAYQSALESSKLGHGYLTYALAEEGLTSTVADTMPVDGKITASEWFEYASRRVPQLQIKALEETEGGSRQIHFESAETADAVPSQKRSRLQTPRFYYNRELINKGMVVHGAQ